MTHIQSTILVFAAIVYLVKSLVDGIGEAIAARYKYKKESKA